ncbi:hypothetical protein MNBD_CPR01-407 [hydrothermal vent metagenome]|uniref:Uncharacterized protein n=1 Tax=hydrothermal vent metagenome TaxID=652676 RepID=A0A3B0VKB2_9ZZZZ
MATSLLASSAVVLVLVHLASTLVGAGSITVAEWQYFRALMDGRIDDGERAHLVALFFSLRFALVLMVLTDIAIATVLFFLQGAHPFGLNAIYWFGLSLAVILAGVSWLRFNARIPFWAGSAIAFSGWWYLAGMDMGYIPISGYFSAMLGFIVSVGVISALFGFVRFLVRLQANNA